MIKQVFWNSAECRIRSFWRLLLMGLFSFLGVLIGTICIASISRSPLQSMLFAAPVTLASLLICVAICGRFLDRRSLRDFGLRINYRWLTDLAFGLVLGFVLVSGIVAVEFAGAWARPTDKTQRLYPEESRTLELATLVLLFVCVGIYEELIFRGYLLKNMAEGWNWRIFGSKTAVLAAVLTTSCVFGIVHTMNPNASAISIGNTVLSGLLLSSGLLLTGELAIPIGYHITWNLTQSTVYGLPVSGLSLGGGLLAVQTSGPEWLTGGNYGPEGSLLCTFALLLGTLLTVIWVRISQRPLGIEGNLAEPPMSAIICAEVAANEGELVSKNTSFPETQSRNEDPGVSN